MRVSAFFVSALAATLAGCSDAATPGPASGESTGTNGGAGKAGAPSAEGPRPTATLVVPEGEACVALGSYQPLPGDVAQIVEWTVVESCATGGGGYVIARDPDDPSNSVFAMGGVKCELPDVVTQQDRTLLRHGIVYGRATGGVTLFPECVRFADSADDYAFAPRSETKALLAFASAGDAKAYLAARTSP